MQYRVYDLNTFRNIEYDFTASIKPGAKLKQIVEEVDVDYMNFTDKDYVIIIGGANDVSCDETRVATSVLEETLANLTCTNVIVMNIPLRHDLQHWSIVNMEVKKANNMYSSICKRNR